MVSLSRGLGSFVALFRGLRVEGSCCMGCCHYLERVRSVLIWRPYLEGWGSLISRLGVGGGLSVLILEQLSAEQLDNYSEYQFHHNTTSTVANRP